MKFDSPIPSGNMPRAKTAHCIGIAVVVFFPFSGLWMGCGGPGAGLGLFRDGSVRVIELEKISYLHLPTLRPCLDSTNPSLLALGDTNRDGMTDFVIAAVAKGRTSGVDRGWIEAYSGRDGAVLWQITGMGEKEARAAGEEKAYHLGEISLVEDLNGDGFPEIYCREAYYKDTAFLFSSRDGSRLGRFPIDRSGYLAQALYCQDLDGNGTVDIVFRAKDENSISIQALSSADLSPTTKKLGILSGTLATRAEWLIPQFRDVDSDGAGDHLLRRGLRQSNRDPVYTFELVMVSGKDFSIIKTFETPRPRMGGKDHYGAAGDLDGDRVDDILMTASVGAGPNNLTSSLRAISGANGNIIWQVLGTQFKGGQTLITVDAKTGVQTKNAPDVKFDGPVLSIPDVNGDAIDDVATVAFAPESMGARRAVLLFSGSDGTPLTTLQVVKGRGTLYSSIILLESISEDGSPGLAVNGMSADGKSIIAIFALSAVR